MAISVKTYVPEPSGPAIQLPTAPTPPNAPLGQLNKELIGLIHKQIHSASVESIERSQKYIDAVMKDVLQQMEDRLASIEAPKPQVMAIEIEGYMQALTAPLNPYQAEILGDMILNSKLGQNTMLVGPAGCGKTTLAIKLAEALGLPFYSTSFTAGASESWILGRHTPNGFIGADFVRAYDSKGLGGVYLADEFDAGDPNLQMIFNAAIENGFFTNPMTGERLDRHPNFVFIAACNTFGKGANHIYTARNRLDAATLRRFARIEMTYDQDLERQLCPDRDLLNTLWNARAKLLELGSDEILSTGCIKRAALQLTAGVPVEKILKWLTAGWAPEMIKQVELDAIKPAKTKGVRKAKDPIVVPASAAQVMAEEEMKF